MTKRTITAWLLLLGSVAAYAGAQTTAPDSTAEATIRELDNQELAGQTVHRRFTNVWKKEGDTWRLWARHANVIPAPEAAKPN
jgi:ketosteroid isomerase-like protein